MEPRSLHLDIFSMLGFSSKLNLLFKFSLRLSSSLPLNSGFCQRIVNEIVEHIESNFTLVHGEQMPCVIDTPQFQIAESFVKSSDLAIYLPGRHKGVPKYRKIYLKVVLLAKCKFSTHRSVPGVLQIKSFCPV